MRAFSFGTVLCGSVLLTCLAPAGAAENFSEQFIAAQLERAQVEPDHRVTIEVDQPVEVVFEVLLKRLADYSDDVVSIRFVNGVTANEANPGVGSERAGSERITTLANGDELVQRLLLVEAPYRFAYFTDMNKSTASVPIQYSIGHYVFEDLGNGKTRAQISVAYAPSSRLLSLFVRAGFSRALQRDFANAEKFLNSQSLP